MLYECFCASLIGIGNNEFGQIITECTEDLFRLVICALVEYLTKITEAIDAWDEHAKARRFPNKLRYAICPIRSETFDPRNGLEGSFDLLF